MLRCISQIIVLILMLNCQMIAAQAAPTEPGTTQTTTDTTIQNPSNTVKTVTNPDGTQTILQTIYCPLPSQLVKNGLYWGTSSGNWKSYSESFDTSIASFVGAQWVGVNVGKMICIYKGNIAMSFPITVQSDTLTQIPTGITWGKDQGGFRNCHSTNTTDCPFVARTQNVNIQQIYKTLDFFKGKPDPLKQNN